GRSDDSTLRRHEGRGDRAAARIPHQVARGKQEVTTRAVTMSLAEPTSFGQRLARWLPGLQLFFRYDRSAFAPDLMAGIVVTLILIPSAIAYADLAKCPPAAGLYAALGGMVLFALVTSTRQVIVGPD